MLYWLMKYVFLGPMLRTVFSVRAEGAENVPATGGAVLASNHLAVADSFFMPLMLPRRVTFLGDPSTAMFRSPGRPARAASVGS